jgi:hypothetical protein
VVDLSVARVRRPWLVGCIGVVMAVLFGFMAFVTYQDLVTLRDHGVETSARVLEVENEGRWTTVELEYATSEGQRVRASTRDVVHSPPPEPGDQLRVVYDPADLSRVADVRARPGFDVPVFGLVMTLLWVGLAGLAFTGRLGPLRPGRKPVAD